MQKVTHVNHPKEKARAVIKLLMLNQEQFQNLHRHIFARNKIITTINQNSSMQEKWIWKVIIMNKLILLHLSAIASACIFSISSSSSSCDKIDFTSFVIEHLIPQYCNSWLQEIKNENDHNKLSMKTSCDCILFAPIWWD